MLDFCCIVEEWASSGGSRVPEDQNGFQRDENERLVLFENQFTGLARKLKADLPSNV